MGYVIISWSAKLRDNGIGNSLEPAHVWGYNVMLIISYPVKVWDNMYSRSAIIIS